MSRGFFLFKKPNTNSLTLYAVLLLNSVSKMVIRGVTMNEMHSAQMAPPCKLEVPPRHVADKSQVRILSDGYNCTQTNHTLRTYLSSKFQPNPPTIDPHTPICSFGYAEVSQKRQNSSFCQKWTKIGEIESSDSPGFNAACVMAIGADIAVQKAPRRSKERLRKCQRRARKQLRKWTHPGGAVRGESAAGDSQLNVPLNQNGAPLQVGCHAPRHIADKSFVRILSSRHVHTQTNRTLHTHLSSKFQPNPPRIDPDTPI